MKVLALLFSVIPVSFFLQILPVDLDKEPAVYQIIISEIMSDPNPCVMLPDAEYIELFNRGSSAVNLEDWSLAFGKHEKVLAATILEPDNYLIVCDSKNENDFQPYGKTLPVQNMPAVVNTGQTLTLKSKYGTVIHSVTFSPDWYQTRLKSEGGWSLEIIDPDNPCGYSENWSESSDLHGGTPGAKNSADANNPDKLSPLLLRAILPSDSTVELLFNERMDSASMNSPWLYSANGGLLHPSMVNPVEPDYTAIWLFYPQQFQPSARYSVTVLNSLKDCAGNAIAKNAFTDFAIPQTPACFDLVINEILFNPLSGKSEFIELYNRSTKVLNLADFSIALAEARSGDITRIVSMHQNPFLLFPGSYVVVTSKAKNLPNDCYFTYPSVIVEQSNLFALPDEEGIIVLTDNLSQTIDEFHYCASMHAEFLNNTEGVSLERINSNIPSNLPGNWHSASTAAGYSTPGTQNSQASLLEYSHEDITLQPETFSPDNDGVDDYMTLHVKLHEPGWMATIIVFDVHGNKIRDLTSKSLLGTEEYFTWDGTMNNQRPADIGIFVVYVEIFNQIGEVKKFKKVVTLTKRL